MEELRGFSDEKIAYFGEITLEKVIDDLGVENLKKICSKLNFEKKDTGEPE